jgi:hypothetical protein
LVYFTQQYTYNKRIIEKKNDVSTNFTHYQKMNIRNSSQNDYLCRKIKKYKSHMNLLNFTTLFPDEASCKAKWKEYRDKQGV